MYGGRRPGPLANLNGGRLGRTQAARLGLGQASCSADSVTVADPEPWLGLRRTVTVMVTSTLTVIVTLGLPVTRDSCRSELFQVSTFSSSLSVPVVPEPVLTRSLRVQTPRARLASPSLAMRRDGRAPTLKPFRI